MAPKKGDLTDSEKKLFESIERGNISDVKAVLAEAGVRVDCLDDQGMTPLQQAAYRGNKAMCEHLLAQGADVNSNYHTSGYTALMFAGLSGNTEVTRLILEAGARVNDTNTLGRNASQMAAFVGQHECVALINNFFSKADLDYYTVPRALEKEPKLAPHLAPSLYKLILNNNLKTVKACLILQEHPELLESGEQVYKLLDLLCEKMMKQKETNEVMAMKFFYYYCIVKKCYKERENLDGWIKSLLISDVNDFEENQEKFIRTSLKEFVYVENQLIQQIVRTLAPVKIGGSPTALDVLDQAINGQRMRSEDEMPCSTCGDLHAEKKCSACKMVHYCNQKCQKLHWFTHKKHCKTLAGYYKKIEEEKAKEQARVEMERLKMESEKQKMPNGGIDSAQNESETSQLEHIQTDAADTDSKENESK